MSELRVAVSIGLELRQRVYAHLLRLGPAYFADTQIGDLSYRLTGDIDRVSITINNMLHQSLPSVLQLIVVLGNLKIAPNSQLLVTTVDDLAVSASDRAIAASRIAC